MSSQTPHQPFTPEEQKLYNQIFHSLDVEQLGIITGETARTTFEKSGLPPSVLGEIWQLADPTNLGFLNQFAFSVALRLIGHVQSGAKPDKSLVDISGPLPRFAGIQTPLSSPPLSSPSVPNAATGPQSNTELPLLTNQDISKFSQLFNKNSQGGRLSGEHSRNIFLKAKLPTPVLGQIWNLVDRNNVGQLSREEFVVAMYLIQNTLNGSIRQLPSSVPQKIWDQAGSFQDHTATGDSAGSSIPFSSPQSSKPVVSRVPSTFTNAANDWTISNEMKQQFNQIFKSLDKENLGVLGPNEVAPFLLTSKLPQDVLATIWDLADIHNSGEFTKDEFAIAMFLVQKKIGGVELPHVIPDSLLPQFHGSEQQQQQPPPQQETSRQPSVTSHAPVSKPSIPSRETKPQSSMSDLVDLNDAFSSSGPSGSAAPSSNDIRNASNSSVRYTPTGSFVPTSTFGQGLAEKEATKAASPQPQQVQTPPVQQKSAEPAFSPPQPRSTLSSHLPNILPKASLPQIPVVLPLPSFSGTQSKSVSTSRNTDLLADSNSEVSGQLSKATTDLANLSNQIGSLTNQTSQLHDKRGRAEQELAKITKLKQDIEAKLSNLQISYEQESKKAGEVEGLLSQSKMETEELRKEASVAEAQYNQVQTNLAALQAELEESQRENSEIKEKLGNLNAEHIELQTQLEKTQAEVKQSKGLKAINSKQLEVNDMKSQDIRQEIEALLASTNELDLHHESLLSKQTEVESLKKSLEEEEQALLLRKEQLEKSEAEFSAKEEEFTRRLEEQKQTELLIQEQDSKIDALVGSLQERKNQLDLAEEQLNDQHVRYAERVQEFSEKQIQDATSGLSAPVFKSTEPEGFEGSRDLATDVPVESTKTRPSVETITGVAAGAVAGGIIGSVATGLAGSESLESENGNTQFSIPTEALTEQGTSIASEDYQYRTANQFNNLEIERAESTTSSVQNNAPASVRGDIDENEADAIINRDGQEKEEETAKPSDVLSRGAYTAGTGTVGGSSGAGSFEIVGDDEPKSESEATLRAQSETSKEAPIDDETVDKIEASIPGAWSSGSEVSKPVAENGTDVVDETESNLGQTKSAVIAETVPTIAVAATSLDDDQDDLYEIPDKAIKNSEGFATDAISKSVVQPNEEFPPIKEFDISESDSDLSSDEEFHETSESPLKKSVDSVPVPPVVNPVITSSAIHDLNKPEPKVAKDLDDDFAGLEQTKEESALEDDDFAGLEAAAEDGLNDLDDSEFINQNDFNQELEGTTFFGADDGQEQQHYPTQQQSEKVDDNEEWEQIFAGFGNQGQQVVNPEATSSPNEFSFDTQRSLKHPIPSSQHGTDISTASHQNHRVATTPRSLAVQELTGMGFSKDEALAALEREKWNLEAATNYLLDNA